MPKWFYDHDCWISKKWHFWCNFGRISHPLQMYVYCMHTSNVNLNHRKEINIQSLCLYFRITNYSDLLYPGVQTVFWIKLRIHVYISTVVKYILVMLIYERIPMVYRAPECPLSCGKVSYYISIMLFNHMYYGSI